MQFMLLGTGGMEMHVLVRKRNFLDRFAKSFFNAIWPKLFICNGIATDLKAKEKQNGLCQNFKFTINI